MLVALNFSREPQQIELAPEGSHGLLVLSSDCDWVRDGVTGSVELGPVEGVVIDYGSA